MLRLRAWLMVMVLAAAAAMGLVALRAGPASATGGPFVRGFAHNIGGSASLAGTVSGDFLVCLVANYGSGTSVTPVSGAGWGLWAASGVNGSGNNSMAIYDQTAAGGTVTCQATPGGEAIIYDFANLTLSLEDGLTEGFGNVVSGTAFNIPFTATAGPEYSVSFLAWGDPTSCGSGWSTIGNDSGGGACAGSVASGSSTETIGFSSPETWVGYFSVSFDITPTGGAPTPASTTTSTTAGTTTTTAATTTTTNADGGTRSLTGSSAGSHCDFWDPACWFAYLFEPSTSAVNSFSSTSNGTWESNWSSNFAAVGTLASTMVGGGYNEEAGALNGTGCGITDCYGGVEGNACLEDPGQVPAFVADGELHMEGVLGGSYPQTGGGGFGGPADLCWWTSQVENVPVVSGMLPIIKDGVTFGTIVLFLLAAVRMALRFLQSGK